MTETLPRSAPSLRELGYITEDEFAALRDLEPASLRNERCRGRGPAFTKMGKSVVYPIAAVRDWLAANTVRPDRTPTLASGRAAAKPLRGTPARGLAAAIGSDPYPEAGR